ncbi:hypothetical protein FAZ95_01130 [Trinickia violacea]|uniref:TolC family protein n=1 Tax=Trinickia violacea TaxID=2571746 RepID=A0A4P8IM51_9BURK|nr:hypothetical protein [Trinickia violacea]QCP47903.1 hypothetical protein FAZ95_01130 [Trinickia violacea]
MSIKRNTFLIATLLFTTSSGAIAQTSLDSERQTYCQYVEDQADAERTLDSGVTGFGNFGESDTNPGLKQVVVGLSKSLSKHLQGDSATRSAALQCQLYGLTLEVDRNVKYAMAALDKRVAAEQVTDLKHVLDVVNEEIGRAESRRRSGNATLADVLQLSQQRDEIYTQYMSARNAAEAQTVPDVPQIDLRQALQQIDDVTMSLEDELNHKEKLQAWDVSLVGGVQKPVFGEPDSTPTRFQPFVSIVFTYNFNAASYGRKLDSATHSLLNMRSQSNDDLSEQVDMLRKDVAARLQVQRESLQRLLEEQDMLSAESDRVRDLDTSEALRTKSQIRIGLTIATMKIDLSRLQIALLTDSYAQFQ